MADGRGDLNVYLQRLGASGMGALLMVTLASAPSAAGEPPAKGPAADLPQYVIGPSDVLQVFVWREAELTRDVTVRLDGKITVALLGDVEAAGRTPQQLGEELGRRLARFIEAPQVSVGVAQPNSTRVYVIGQVLKPGDFPLTGRTTVLQALALAGGFKDFAKSDSIVIVRREGGSESFLPVNYKKLEGGRDITQDVVLRPGDVIVVP